MSEELLDKCWTFSFVLIGVMSCWLLLQIGKMK